MEKHAADFGDGRFLARVVRVFDHVYDSAYAALRVFSDGALYLLGDRRGDRFAPCKAALTALRLSENADARIIEKGTVNKSLKPVFYKNETRQSRKERRLCRVVFWFGFAGFCF